MANKQALSVMGDGDESCTGQRLSHWRHGDNWSIRDELLHFCQHGWQRLGYATLPFPHILGDGLNFSTKGKLAQTKHPTGLQNPICSRLNGDWIHPEKADQPRPK
jgi:hypothetical protein